MRTYSKQKTVSDREQSKRPVNVLISGFSQQTQASVEEIASIIDSIPSFHLTGLDQIVYDPNWETKSTMAWKDICPRYSKAMFLGAERKILVFKFDDLKELQHILYHEIGHHVFERTLHSTLRKQWVTIINPRSRHITRYAARNAIEDFAECYAIFIQDPKRMEKIYKKYVFLRDKVFAGMSFNVKKGHLDISI